jgi:hypothetical protein
LSDEVVQRACAVGRALVIDDVLVSGATLVALRDQLFRATQKAGRDLELWAFVVVSRPARPEDRRHVERRYGKREGTHGGVEFAFRAAEHILLPGAGACPWCRERELLQRMLGRLNGPAREQAGARITQLRGAALDAPILATGDDGDLRTIGSFFGVVHSPAAFAAASAVAQNMMCSFESNRTQGSVRVLDVALIVQAFYDTILVAGQLRRFEPRDLRDHGHDAELSRAIASNAREYALATLVELGLAAFEHKLPRGPVIDVLTERNEEPLAAMLLAMLALD